MAVEDSDLKIPNGILVYRCSNCLREWPTHYGTQRHTEQNVDCRAVKASVETFVRGAALASLPSTVTEAVAEEPKNESPVAEEVELKSESEPEPIPVRQPMPESVTLSPRASIQARVQAPMPSMAEQAASRPLPAWADTDATDDQIPEEPDEDEPDFNAPLLRPRYTGASLQISPEPWLIILWQTALRDGYDGSISDWVHDEIESYFVMLGIKIELLAVPEEERNRLLETVGLRNA